jgi:hypothetical protein
MQHATAAMALGARQTIFLTEDRATRLIGMQVARAAPRWPVPGLMHSMMGRGDRVTYVKA